MHDLLRLADPTVVKSRIAIGTDDDRVEADAIGEPVDIACRVPGDTWARILPWLSSASARVLCSALSKHPLASRSV